MLKTESQQSEITPVGVRKLARLARSCATAVATSAAVGLAFVAAPASAALDPSIVANLEAGSKKKSTCIGCHGIPDYKTAFPLVYRVPKISGQSEKYLQSALIAYRNGERSHPSMRAIAGSMTDQDIADLAAYYANKK
jgi:cytochrome c553